MRRTVDGQRNMDIARDTGFSREYVSMIRNCTLGRAYMEKLQAEREQDVKEVQRRLTEMELKAVRVLEKTMDAALASEVEGEDGKLKKMTPKDRQEMCPSPAQIRAAEKHLERQGYAKPPLSTVLHKHLGSTQVIADMKRRYAEVAAQERDKIEQHAEIEQNGEIVKEAGSGLDTEESNL